MHRMVMGAVEFYHPARAPTCCYEHRTNAYRCAFSLTREPRAGRLRGKEKIMATKAAKPIPDGYHSITPYLVVQDGARALDFYQRAFGAKDVHRMNGPNGKIMHAEFKIGDSMVM